MSASFGLTYQNVALERLLGKHAVFHEGPQVSAADQLWSEFQACLRLGIDPDVHFSKDRFSRMLNTGGVVADGAIRAMREWDMAKEREQQAEIERKRKR